MKFTEQDVRELFPRIKEPSFVSSLNTVLIKYEINTPLRVAAFLARMGHESLDFTRTEEIWTNTSAQQKYDVASGSTVSKRLGNTQRGDGIKYKGRGWVQITGKYNYQQYSKAVGFDFVTFPERLKEYPWAADCAGWYWSTRGLNKLADKGDIKGIVAAINGGTNGLIDTEIRYAKLLVWFKKKGF